MGSTDCPPRGRLVELLEDGLGGPEGERVAAHVRACAGCQRALDELTADADAFGGRLRRLAGGPAPPSYLAGRRPAPPEVPGYEVLGVLGRGGMGVVYQARDRALGRLVALKTVRGDSASDPEQLRRFRREAELLARLRHPNIVQVHEVGEADGLPFFVLEYVEGGSLAQRLTGQPLPAAVAAGLVEKLARAVHAAHLAGVVHRDLKPANVLLQGAGGAAPTAGQAQEGAAPALAPTEAALRALQEAVPKVSDFGLARPLRAGDALTETGAVLGTPEYMAPEQALGKGREAGPACDVHALGVILYQLLTGRLPFVGEQTMDVLLQVAHQEPLPPRRLWAKVPRDLETVCLRCLDKDPHRRYGSAEALADDLGRYQRGEPVEARRTSVLTRGLKWPRRRPAAAALVGACVLLLALAAGGGAWYRVARAERAAREAATERGVTAALLEAKALAEQARRLSGSPDQWQATLKEALSASKRAQGLADSGEASAELRRQVRQLRAELDEAESQRALLAKLDDIRLDQAQMRAGRFDFASAAPRYAAAFRDHRLDVLALAPAAAAERLRAHPHWEALLAAVEDWARVAPDQAEQRQLAEILKALDPDPGSFRNRWRAALARQDRAALEGLVAEAARQDLPSVAVVNLAAGLDRIQRWGTAVRLLREAQARRPNDFWLNFELALAYRNTEPPRADEAGRYYTAALALRRDSPAVLSNLGEALEAQGLLEEATRCYHQALALDARLPQVHTNLGNALRKQGRLEEAVRRYRRALALDPRLAKAHNNLGDALVAQGRPEEAVRCCRRALQLDPTLASAHNNLGTALQALGRLDEAIRCYRTAVHLDPRYAQAHSNLGGALREQGRPEEAVRCCRQALDLDPRLAGAHHNLGTALQAQGRVEEAIRCYHKALDLDPRHALAHNNLGNALQRQGRLDEAVRCYHRALALDPRHALAHNNLGNALQRQGRLDEAICCRHRAVDLDPKFAAAHNNLGLALNARGRQAEAARCFRRALDLNPRDASTHSNLGNALKDQGRLGDALCCYNRALELNPKFALAHNNLGHAFQSQGRLEEAIRCFRRAIQLDPKLALAHGNLGVAEKQRGRFAEALASLGEARKLIPPGSPHFAFAQRQIRETEQLLELERKLPAVLKGEAKPQGAAERVNLAWLCQQPYQRRYAAAARLYAEAFADQPALAPGHRYNAACAAALAGCGQGQDAATLAEKLRAPLRQQALGWLEADLVQASKQLGHGQPADRAVVRQQLRSWQQDADLAGVRDPAALAGLPAEERAAWQKLWAEVDLLIRPRAAK